MFVMMWTVVVMMPYSVLGEYRLMPLSLESPNYAIVYEFSGVL